MTIEFTPEAILANVKVSAFMALNVSGSITDPVDPQSIANRDALFAMVKVDLSKPDNKCVFLYELFLVDEAMARDFRIYGMIETTAEWAIALCQDGINSAYEQIWQYGGKDVSEAPKIPITGVFDCTTANAMLLPGQIVRGTGVGNIDYLPMERGEFKWCMEMNNVIPDLIEYAWQQHGITDSDIEGKIQDRYEIVTIPQDKFVGAAIPATCEGVKPTVGTTTGTEITTTQDEDWTWPIILGSLAGITLIAMGWLAFSPYKKSKEEEMEALTVRGY